VNVEKIDKLIERLRSLPDVETEEPFPNRWPYCQRSPNDHRS